MEIEKPGGNSSGMPVVFCDNGNPEGENEGIGLLETGGKIAGHAPLKYFQYTSPAKIITAITAKIKIILKIFLIFIKSYNYKNIDIEATLEKLASDIIPNKNEFFMILAYFSSFSSLTPISLINFFLGFSRLSKKGLTSFRTSKSNILRLSVA